MPACAERPRERLPLAAPKSGSNPARTPVTETVTHIAQQHAIGRSIALLRLRTFDRATY